MSILTHILSFIIGAMAGTLVMAIIAINDDGDDD